MLERNEPSSAEEIVERFWPYDGPHSRDTVESAAQAIAGLVRYLNNATWNPQRLPAPGLYRVLSNLNSMMYGLDQLLNQLTTATDRVADDPTLYDDRRDRPARNTAVEVGSHLKAAAGALDGPRSAVERAVQLASHLGHESVRR